MATTIKTPTTEGDPKERNNRGLIVMVALLALALVVAGAWVLNGQAAKPETAAPTEVRELIDDYYSAWNDHDGDAFLAVVTQDYLFDNGLSTYGRAAMSSKIMNQVTDQVEQVGSLVVIDDGITVSPFNGVVAHYVANVTRTTSLGSDTEDGAGISTFVVIDSGSGLKIAEHHFVGNVRLGGVPQ